MVKILKLDKIDIECDCGNILSSDGSNSTLSCNKCGNFYEITPILCPEHR